MNILKGIYNHSSALFVVIGGYLYLVKKKARGTSWLLWPCGWLGEE
jgi:23S rRNA maturation mini-RNase III